jgi:hypothetical protein
VAATSTTEFGALSMNRAYAVSSLSTFWTTSNNELGPTVARPAPPSNTLSPAVMRARTAMASWFTNLPRPINPMNSMLLTLSALNF